jgi:excisionase family DNA binding protein
MHDTTKSSEVGDAERTASPSDLLSAEEVIDRLLEDANLRRVAATCVLPAVRVGSGWRFRRSDLDDWIRRQSESMLNAE